MVTEQEVTAAAKSANDLMIASGSSTHPDVVAAQQAYEDLRTQYYTQTFPAGTQIVGAGGIPTIITPEMKAPTILAETPQEDIATGAGGAWGTGGGYVQSSGYPRPMYGGVGDITLTPDQRVTLGTATYTGTMTADERAEMNRRLLINAPLGRKGWETPTGQAYQGQVVNQLFSQFQGENITNLSRENIARAVKQGTTEFIGERPLTTTEKADVLSDVSKSLSAQLIAGGFVGWTPEVVSANVFGIGPRIGPVGDIKYIGAPGVFGKVTGIGSVVITGPGGREATIDLSTLQAQIGVPVPVSISGAEIKPKVEAALGEIMQPAPQESFFVSKYGGSEVAGLERVLGTGFSTFKRDVLGFAPLLPAGQQAKVYEKARLGEPFTAGVEGTPYSPIYESGGTYYPNVSGAIVAQRAQRWSDINRYLAYGESTWYKFEELMPDIPILESVLTSGIRFVEVPTRAVVGAVSGFGELFPPLARQDVLGYKAPFQIQLPALAQPAKQPIESLEAKYTVPVYQGRDLPLGIETTAFKPEGGIPASETTMWLTQDLPMWLPLIAAGAWRILPETIKAGLIGKPSPSIVQGTPEKLPFLRKIGPSEIDLGVTGEFGMEPHYAWETVGQSGILTKTQYAGGRFSDLYNFIKGYPEFSPIEAQQIPFSGPFDIRIPGNEPTTIFRAQPAWGKADVVAGGQKGLVAVEQRFGQPYAISRDMFMEMPDVTGTTTEGVIVMRRGVAGVPGVSMGGVGGPGEPSVFYHGTSSTNLPGIMEEGLSPVSRTATGGIEGQAVYLTSKPATAREFAQVAADTTGGKPVLLKVMIPEEQTGLLTARGGNFFFTGKIGPQQIYQVTQPIESVVRPTITLGVEKGVAGGIGAMQEYEQMAVKLGVSLEDLALVDSNVKRLIFGSQGDIITTQLGKTFGLAAPAKTIVSTPVGIVVEEPNITVPFRNLGAIEQTGEVIGGAQHLGRQNILTLYPTSTPVRNIAVVTQYGGLPISGFGFEGEALPMMVIRGKKIEAVGGGIARGLGFGLPDGGGALSAMTESIMKRATETGQSLMSPSFVSVAPRVIPTVARAVSSPLIGVSALLMGPSALNTMYATSATKQFLIQTPSPAVKLVGGVSPVAILSPFAAQVSIPMAGSVLKSTPMTAQATAVAQANVTAAITAAATTHAPATTSAVGLVVPFIPKFGGASGGGGSRPKERGFGWSRPSKHGIGDPWEEMVTGARNPKKRKKILDAWAKGFDIIGGKT